MCVLTEMSLFRKLHFIFWSGFVTCRILVPQTDSYHYCCSVAHLCPTVCAHGLQHTRPPCTSPSPKVCPSLCPLHRWCHPDISSSDALFSFCPQSFPASGTFPMSHLFASHDQNTRVSASASVLLMSIQGCFTLRLTSLELNFKYSLFVGFKCGTSGKEPMQKM